RPIADVQGQVKTVPGWLADTTGARGHHCLHRSRGGPVRVQPVTHGEPAHGAPAGIPVTAAYPRAMGFPSDTACPSSDAQNPGWLHAGPGVKTRIAVHATPHRCPWAISVDLHRPDPPPGDAPGMPYAHESGACVRFPAAHQPPYGRRNVHATGNGLPPVCHL